MSMLLLNRGGAPFAAIVAGLAFAAGPALPGEALAQQAQNPSPMVEHTRPHPRLSEEKPPGSREALELGSFFLPERLKPKPGRVRTVPLLVVFHGGSWLPELVGHRAKMAVIGVQLQAGTGGYAAAVADPQHFTALLESAARAGGVRFRPVTVAGWSAGCGAIRELARQPGSLSRIDRVLAIDGIHTDYEDGKPGPVESRLATEKLEPWVRLAREAIAGRKRVLIVHTEIFPGTFASTTETADWLVRELGLRQKPVAKRGPMGTVILGETRAGRLRILGVAGNSAPDHVDLLHALPDLLRMKE